MRSCFDLRHREIAAINRLGELILFVGLIEGSGLGELFEWRLLRMLV